MKNLIKNNNNKIINNCNYVAYNITKNQELYNCVIAKKFCKDINQYKEFIIIRNNCINDTQSYQGFIILSLIAGYLIFTLSF